MAGIGSCWPSLFGNYKPTAPECKACRFSLQICTMPRYLIIRCMAKMMPLVAALAKCAIEIILDAICHSI